MHKDKVKCYVSCVNTKVSWQKDSKMVKLSLRAINKRRLLISSHGSKSMLALVMWVFPFRPISGSFGFTNRQLMLIAWITARCWEWIRRNFTRARRGKSGASASASPVCLPGAHLGSGQDPACVTGQGDQRSLGSTEALLCPRGRLERAHMRCAWFSFLDIREGQDALPDQKTLNPAAEEMDLIPWPLCSQLGDGLRASLQSGTLARKGKRMSCPCCHHCWAVPVLCPQPGTWGHQPLLCSSGTIWSDLNCPAVPEAAE